MCAILYLLLSYLIALLAICTPGCQNGGECVAPNQCSCTSGMWTGNQCEEGNIMHSNSSRTDLLNFYSCIQLFVFLLAKMEVIV